MSERDVVEVVARACARRCTQCNDPERWPRHLAMAEDVLEALDEYVVGVRDE